MCDYSLHHVASRPAKVGDKLVTTSFSNSITRGFTEVGEPNVAVCVLPGTELAFEREVESEPTFGFLANKKHGQLTARFRYIDNGHPNAHRDSLEFADGQVVLLTRLCEGQRATVLQLPASKVLPEGTQEPVTTAQPLPEGDEPAPPTRIAEVTTSAVR